MAGGSEPRLKITWGALVVIIALAAFLWWTDTLGTGDDQRPPEATTAATQDPEPSTGAASPSPTASTTPTPSARPTATLTRDPVSGLPVVRLSELPVEAAEVVADIDAGGPYEFERDGITFGNYEGILPEEERGYYREYTVPTPGLDHRGARRIVTGGDTLYWTADHYESFSVIAR